MINYLIPIPSKQAGKFSLLRKYEWTSFQFRKDTKVAMLMGNVRFYEDDGQGGYGAEINSFPIVPLERNTHTEEGRDFINKSNGVYCKKTLIDNPNYDPQNPDSQAKILGFVEVISNNMVDQSLIISQFDYFESLLGNGVNILQLIPLVVQDLAARGILD